MNSKKAKRIRQQVRRDTVGMPEVAYGMVVTKNAKMPVMSDALTPDGVDRPRAVRIVRTARALVPNCTRMLYKVRKKAAK